jgi:phage-related holin
MDLDVKGYLLSFLAMCWAFVAPIHTLIVATGALVLFDMVTGIAKAIKNKNKVTSNRMRHTITKGMAYQIAVLTGFLIDQVMGLELTASRVIAGVICLVEAKSVLENVEAMTGVSIWGALIDKLKPPAVPAEQEAAKKTVEAEVPGAEDK